MGFLDEIKKVLFGAKAVTKSAARQAAESTKKAGAEIKDASEEMLHKAEEAGEKLWEKAEETGEKLWDEAEELVKKARNKLDPEQENDIADTSSGSDDADDDIFSAIEEEETGDIPFHSEAQTSHSKVEEIGEKIGEKGSEAFEKFKETAEKVGEKVLHASEEAGKKFQDVAEDVGEKVLEKGGEAFDKAKELGGKLLDKAEELIEKAQQEAAKDIDETIDEAQRMEEDLKKKAQAIKDRYTGKKTTDPKYSDSNLTGKDDFFERARRFAEGDYHNEGAKKPTGDMEIKKDPNYKPDPKKKEGTVPGFEDHDGDGNEIIDDAILDED